MGELREGDMMIRIGLRRLTGWLVLISTTTMIGCIPSFGARRSFAIPNSYPLGSTVRNHWHQQEMNGEADDFILHRHEFVNNTAELNCAGKDHIMEIEARMRSAPFPVLIERSEHNSDPEIDQLRRTIVAQILSDHGNPDAMHRVLVAPAYNKHMNGMEAEPIFNRFIMTRNNGNNGNGGDGGGGGTGF